MMLVPVTIPNTKWLREFVSILSNIQTLISDPQRIGYTAKVILMLGLVLIGVILSATTKMETRHTKNGREPTKLPSKKIEAGNQNMREPISSSVALGSLKISKAMVFTGGQSPQKVWLKKGKLQSKIRQVLQLGKSTGIPLTTREETWMKKTGWLWEWPCL